VIKFPEEAQRANFRAAWFNTPPEMVVEEEEEGDEDMESVSSLGIFDDTLLDFLDV